MSMQHLLVTPRSVPLGAAPVPAGKEALVFSARTAASHDIVLQNRGDTTLVFKVKGRRGLDGYGVSPATGRVAAGSAVPIVVKLKVLPAAHSPPETLHLLVKNVPAAEEALPSTAVWREGTGGVVLEHKFTCVYEAEVDEDDDDDDDDDDGDLVSSTDLSERVSCASPCGVTPIMLEEVSFLDTSGGRRGEELLGYRTPCGTPRPCSEGAACSLLRSMLSPYPSVHALAHCLAHSHPRIPCPHYEATAGKDCPAYHRLQHGGTHLYDYCHAAVHSHNAPPSRTPAYWSSDVLATHHQRLKSYLSESRRKGYPQVV